MLNPVSYSDLQGNLDDLGAKGERGLSNAKITELRLIRSMAKNKRHEKRLDAALKTAASSLPELCQMLLAAVGETDDNLKYSCGRSDNPWYRGLWQGRKRDSETDILIIFESDKDKSRFALHIENKVSADFQPDQAELYRQRGEDCKGKTNWGNYQRFKTLLIAPCAYLTANSEQAEKFDGMLSHEVIGRLVAEFA